MDRMPDNEIHRCRGDTVSCPSILYGLWNRGETTVDRARLHSNPNHTQCLRRLVPSIGRLLLIGDHPVLCLQSLLGLFSFCSCGSFSIGVLFAFFGIFFTIGIFFGSLFGVLFRSRVSLFCIVPAAATDPVNPVIPTDFSYVFTVLLKKGGRREERRGAGCTTTTTQQQPKRMAEWQRRDQQNNYYVENARHAMDRMRDLRGRLQREALPSSIRLVDGYSDLSFRMISPYGELLFTDPADEHFGLDDKRRTRHVSQGLARIQCSWNRSGTYYQQVVVFGMEALQGVMWDHLRRGLAK